MGALSAGEQTRVEALVAHCAAGTVVEAKVVADTLGRGCGGEASRKGNDIKTHGGLSDDFSGFWIAGFES